MNIRPSCSLQNRSNLLEIFLLLTLHGCGGGTAVFLLEDSNDSHTGLGPAITGLSISSLEKSPAMLQFNVRNEPQQVAVRYDLGAATSSDADETLPLATLVDTNMQPLPNPLFLSEGEKTLLWNFEADFETDRVDDVMVLVQGEGGAKAEMPEVQLGNGLPVILDLSLADSSMDEYFGEIELKLNVMDSPEDSLDADSVEGFIFEYRIDGNSSWTTTQRVQVEEDTDAAHYSLTWDSGRDLEGKDVSARFRVTPTEIVDQAKEKGKPEAINVRVDNNQPPAIVPDTVGFAVSQDRRGVLALGFSISDIEQDETNFFFQWRGPDQFFFDEELVLPEDLIEIQEILSDPAMRKAKQICGETPFSYRGRISLDVAGLDSTRQVRLPELAAGAAGILSTDPSRTGENPIEGRNLELLRGSQLSKVVSGSWSEPIGGSPFAEPFGDGTTCILLDQEGSAWQLRRIHVATGELIQRFGMSGMPEESRALDLLAGQDKGLVAVNYNGDQWRIYRVALEEDVESELLYDSMEDILSGKVEAGTVRDVLSLSESTALVTIDGKSTGSLVLIDFCPGGEDPEDSEDCDQSLATTLLRNLETPSGMAADPFQPQVVYLAERDRDRVLVVRLNTLSGFPLSTSSENPCQEIPFPGPDAISLEDAGARLLVVCDDDGDGVSDDLRGLQLNRADHSSFSIAIIDAAGNEIEDAPLHGVETGPDDLRLLTLTLGQTPAVAAGGGVEQISVIAEYDPWTQIATVEAPFQAALNLESWRLRDGAQSIEGLCPGNYVFGWDSTETEGTASQVFVRAFAFDKDLGAEVDFGDVAKKLSGIFAPSRANPLSSGAGTKSVACADLNGDGALDLVCASPGEEDFPDDDSVRIFFQQATPGTFDEGSTSLMLFDDPEDPGDDATMPTFVYPADLDGDGDLDVVCAYEGDKVLIDKDGDGTPEEYSIRDGLGVFIQTSCGIFDPAQAFLITDPTDADMDAPDAIAVADLNQDGLVDLISTNHRSNNLAVFFQNPAEPFGESSFGIPCSLKGGNMAFPISVAAADLDGDGLLDLVSANALSIDPDDFNNQKGDLTVFLFDNSPQADPECPFVFYGTLEDKRNLRRPEGVIAADLDGDGDNDIACTSSDTDRLFLYLQSENENGDLMFDQKSLSDPSGVSPQPLVAADFDADGDNDLACGNVHGNNISVFYQTSPGSFAPAGQNPIKDQDQREPEGLAAGDLDGDGDLDLVSANEVSSSLTIFMNSLPGQYLPSQQNPLLDANLGQPESVTAADLDADGDTDFVVASDGSSSLSAFLQVSPGIFEPSPENPINGDGDPLEEPETVIAADLNGDGLLDLVSANEESGNVTIYRQDPPGVFMLVQELSGGNLVEPKSVIAADLNGDGRLDLASVDEKASPKDDLYHLTVFLQFLTGEFENPSFETGEGLQAPEALAAGDLDSDGDVDLVCNIESGTIQSGLAIFLNVPPPDGKDVFFVPFSQNPLGGGVLECPGAIVTADLDGDGDLDLACADEDGNQLGLFTQRQGATGIEFDAQYFTDDLLVAPQSITAADIDGDGDMDLICATEGNALFDGGLVLFEQTSPGRFEPSNQNPITDLSSIEQEFVTAADLDGDGDVDFISTSPGTGGVSIFFNDG